MERVETGNYKEKEVSRSKEGVRGVHSVALREKNCKICSLGLANL